MNDIDLYLKRESIIRKCVEECDNENTHDKVEILKSKLYTACTYKPVSREYTEENATEYKHRIDEAYDYTIYLRKEFTLWNCINFGEPVYSPYQMQRIKSMFYVAIALDDNTIEYKKKIDEVYKYARTKLYEYNKRKENKEKANKLREQKRIKNQKLHNYIQEKDKNFMERVTAFNDHVNPPTKLEDTSFKKVNSIYNIKENIYTNGCDITELVKSNNPEVSDYIKLMIEHAFLSYISLDMLNESHPRYEEARQRMFDFIRSYLDAKETVDYEIFVKILRDEELLRQFMFEANPLYLDKLSEEYKMIRASKKALRKQDPIKLDKINQIISSVKNSVLNPEIINLIIDFDNNKTLQKI